MAVQAGCAEWVQVDGLVIVATPDGALAMSAAELSPIDPRLAPMVGPGSTVTTTHLLDAMVALSQRRALTGPRCPLTLAGYVEYLVAAYHSTIQTPGLLQTAATRFDEAGLVRLGSWARHIAAEERGHHDLALADLDALGYPRADVVAGPIPDRTRRLLDLAKSAVNSRRPVRLLGYAYTVERTASSLRDRHLAALVRVIPPGVDALRVFTVHSGIGEDAQHSADLAAFVAELDAPDRLAVCLAARETARILFDDHLSHAPIVVRPGRS